MKLSKCRACGKEVSPQAKSCPHCGQPNPANKPEPTVISTPHDVAISYKAPLSSTFITAAFAIIVVVGGIGVSVKNKINDNKTPPPRLAVTRSVNKANTPAQPKLSVEQACKPVEGLISGGLLKKMEYDVSWYHVNPLSWRSLNIDDKRLVMYGLRMCQATINDKDTEIVRIYDYMSGKLLAKGDGQNYNKFY